MTCEHLQPILESDRDTGLLCHVAMLVARGCVPPICEWDAWVVVSDVFRRIMAVAQRKQQHFSSTR